jgi:hypothetical protein
LREDKLAGDLGNVIEATSIRGSSVGFFCSRKISTRQFAASRGLPALLPRSGNLIMVLAHQPNRDSPLSVKRNL